MGCRAAIALRSGRDLCRVAVRHGGDQWRTGADLVPFELPQGAEGRRGTQILDRQGRHAVALPTRPIDATKKVHPMHESKKGPRVMDIMDRQVVSVGESEEIRTAAQKLLKGETNHLPVIGNDGRLVGIVTTFDVSKAVANPGKACTVSDIMKKKVITTTTDEAVDIAVRKLEQNNISALPVVDRERHVIGMLTAINLGKLFGGRWLK